MFGKWQEDYSVGNIDVVHKLLQTKRASGHSTI